MFAKIQRIHFVGIGGIGMSGIAEVLLNLGYKVSGSDLRSSAVTQRLATLGAVVFEGHRAENIDGAEVVVASSAITLGNPEVSQAHAVHIPVIQRAEMLAELMRLKYGIAIAGMHGKTTTTSMIAAVLAGGGLDPTGVVGGRVDAMGSNARLGRSQYLVAEADESDRSFLMLSPILAIVTNLDREHMDTYGESDDADFQLQMRPRPVDCHAEFEVSLHGLVLGPFRLHVPGKHNVLNATAAVAVGLQLGMAPDAIAEGLETFRGVDRRFQVKGKTRGVTVVDDYGHHPTEIRATLAAARECGFGRVLVMFQPHRYTRTLDLLDEFATAFGDADTVAVLPIYAASEEPIPGVTAEALAARITGTRTEFVADFAAAIAAVLSSARQGDLILTLGAGSVSQLGPQILAALEAK